MDNWKYHQELEGEFWGTCANTYGEETKQLLYADRMGFKPYHDGLGPFNFAGEGLSYLDIGGGPSSILLKFKYCSARTVIDPCPYPRWAAERYAINHIDYFQIPAEEISFKNSFDIVFIYNCLQHVIDPELIIKNALGCLKPRGKLHMFEWIDIPVHDGHPHMLTQEKLESWTRQKGKIETFSGKNECYGTAWYL